MARAIHYEGSTGAYSADLSSPGYQAYQILHIAFVAAPLLAGLDKFADLLTNWDKYLTPQVGDVLRAVHIGSHQFMLGVGVIEIVAALIVAARPKIGAYVVAAWLLGIIVNLLILGSYFDVALRDFGLFLGAVALGRMSMVHEHDGEHSRRAAMANA